MTTAEILFKRSHCDFCIKFPCSKNDSCYKLSSCPCLPCPNNCGSGMHSCKLDDHLHFICSKQIVPCINQQYGCPIQLPRDQLASHLFTCCANVIHCPVIWYRAIKTGKVASMELLHKNNQPGDFVTKNFSYAMKMADLRDYHCELIADKNGYQVRKKVGDQPLGLIHPSLVDDVCIRTRWLLNDLYGHDGQHGDGGDGGGGTSSTNTISTRLFACRTLVRRDEYAFHMSLHCDCHCSLDWLEQSCPLKYRGCEFAVARCLPYSLNHELRFSMENRSFFSSWKLSQCLCAPPPFSPTPWAISQCHLLDLPTDVLYHICHFLDSPSLQCLAQTCVRLRDIVLSDFHLQQHSIVYFNWYKSSASGASGGMKYWQKTKLIKQFANVSSSSHVDKIPWHVNPNVSAQIQQHLQKCEFYDKNEIKQNFSYATFNI